MSEKTHDALFQAFINPKSPDVFRGVLSTADVWRPDPVDVPSIHAQAREAFESLIERVTTAEKLDESERLWLIRGEPGAGKTHLISAFRTWLHENGKGFLAYLQMQTGIQDYNRYILYSVIDSLAKPMSVRRNPNSSLEVISRAVLSEAIVRSDDDDATFNPRQVAEQLMRKRVFGTENPAVENVLIALLTLQLNDSVLTQRAIRYLRCDELSEYERNSIGYLARPSEPADVVAALSDIIWTSFGKPLVICLDQLDDFYGPNMEESGGRFSVAVKTLRSLLQNEKIVAIIGILDEKYGELRRFLMQPEIDRIEGGILPITLGAVPTKAEIRDLIAMRLAYLYEMMSLDPPSSSELYPFLESIPAQLEGMRFRTILRSLRAAQLSSMKTGRAPVVSAEEPSAVIPTNELELASQWNDFRLTYDEEPETAHDRLIALAFAVEELASTFPQASGARLTVEAESGTLERLVDGQKRREVVAIVDQAPQGGSLLRAVETLAQRAVHRESRAVAVRSSDFPTNPKLKTTKQLGEFVKAGNRRVAFAAGEWRAIAAYRAFLEKHGSTPGFAAWRRDEHPLGAQSGLQMLLELDEAPAIGAASKQDSILSEPVVEITPPQPEVTALPPPGTALNGAHATPLAPPRPDDPIVLGETDRGERVELQPQTLNRHLAILGGAGSGKTTLAFAILEGLLLRGVPAILIDRKGDLASYASDAAWQRTGVDAARRDMLQKRLDVQLFTPGVAAGRNLRIPTLPGGLDELPLGERQEAARDAALGLAAMLEWGSTKRAHLALLTQAIETYGEVAGAAPTLEDLTEFIADGDARLIGALGRLDPKLLKNVAGDLSSLSINAKKLLPSDAEPLDIEMLLGHGAHAVAGKTRLSIVYVGGLGEGTDMLFWVSRFLSEYYAYGRRNPRKDLQGIAFFDEADRYLPATSKPITKEPMENAIRRLRSAGLGIALATQSPGDLDYKSKENVTTWLAGRVSQSQAQEKLRAVFSNDTLVDQLATFKVGQFVLKTDEGARRFRSDLPIVIPQQIEEAEIIRLASRR